MSDIKTLMALVDKYGEACDNYTLGAQSAQAINARAAIEATILADREKRAQAAQGVERVKFERKVYRNGPEYREYLNARFGPAKDSLSFPWQGHRWAYQFTGFDDAGDFESLYRFEPTEASKPVQAEAPSDDADPLTPEQEEWVMDLAEKHNLGRRVPQIGAMRGVAPDVFYTDASYRTHELFCFAAELLAAKQAGREPVASIYVSPNGEREFDDWGHDLPVGRNELCLATKQAEAPTASNARERALPAPQVLHKVLDHACPKCQTMIRYTPPIYLGYTEDQMRAALAQVPEQVAGDGWRAAYAKGFYAAASWAKRPDLYADIGSPAYVKEMESYRAARTSGEASK